MGATERVKEYLIQKGISKYRFSKETGFSNKFLDNSNNMGTNKAEIIVSHYTDLNVIWLITGKGPMLSDSTNNYSNNEIVKPSDVSEDQAPYSCASCDENSKKMEAMLSTNEALRKEIEKLKFENKK